MYAPSISELRPVGGRSRKSISRGRVGIIKRNRAYLLVPSGVGCAFGRCDGGGVLR
jgi:hypothetical protein